MVCILSGIWSALLPEGLHHMGNGTSDCAFSQSVVLLPQKSFCSDSHGKCTQHENLLLMCEAIHVNVVTSDGFAILLPSPPSLSPVVVCFSHSSAFMGSHCSVKVVVSARRYWLITLGGGNISKCAGICSGKWEQRILVSSSSLQCQSQERASAILFFIPEKHWLYLLTLLSMKRHMGH
jgi:hypothetical protein